jgi:hypothetical protein
MDGLFNMIENPKKAPLSLLKGMLLLAGLILLKNISFFIEMMIFRNLLIWNLIIFVGINYIPVLYFGIRMTL